MSRPQILRQVNYVAMVLEGKLHKYDVIFILTNIQDLMMNKTNGIYYYYYFKTGQFFFLIRTSTSKLAVMAHALASGPDLNKNKKNFTFLFFLENFLRVKRPIIYDKQ